MKNIRKIVTLSALMAALFQAQARQDFFELAPIKYSETASEDAVARLSAELSRGDWVVPPGDSKSFLKALLEKLGISPETQVLVFSKTSLQTGLISQRNPRVLYFSPDAYVGWVPGGKIEIIIEDEKLGPIFYVVKPPMGGEAAKFVRATDSCLTCHATSRTEGVPGMFIRSVVPDENAHAILRLGTSLVTDATPLKERWGGWYVTGASDDPHLGNRWVTDGRMEQEQFPALKEEPREDLSEFIDVDKYLRPTSDIVALMVLEHQCQTHNLLTKAKYGYRRARYFQESIHPDQDAEVVGGMTWKSADQSAREIVDVLLFKNEVALGGEGVEGSEEFVKALAAFAPETEGGKSLASLRLYERLFRYRCSYMIYSKAFRSLPDLVKNKVFVLLRNEVSGSTRRILEETVPGFVQK